MVSPSQVKTLRPSQIVTSSSAPQLDAASVRSRASRGSSQRSQGGWCETRGKNDGNHGQWEFQDPKIEVLYHYIHYKAIFGGYIPLNSPYIGLIYGYIW